MTIPPLKAGLVALALSAAAPCVLVAGVAQAARGTEAARYTGPAKSKVRSAEKAMAEGNFPVAVRDAEAAVALEPNSAEVRFLLGQAYFGSGRFQSATAVFQEVLMLAPGANDAALQLILSQLATGRQTEALSALRQYANMLGAGDQGLALALAGDAEGGVAILESAIRAGASDSKTRQNLGVAYGLQGRWQNAQVMAVQDLSESEADTRVHQWQEMAGMPGSAPKMAFLTGIQPTADPGLPERLAWRASPPQGEAMADAGAAPPNLGEAQSAASEPASAQVADASSTPVASPSPSASNPSSSAPTRWAASSNNSLPAAGYGEGPSAPTRETQALAPVRVAAPARQHAFKAGPQHVGAFVAQLGAFTDAGRARAAWLSLDAKLGGAGVPVTGVAQTGAAQLVRLAAGGFATREQAGAFCARVISIGQSCFVRAAQADTILTISGSREVQLAER